MLSGLFHSPLSGIGLKFLRNKLSRNYRHQIAWSNHFVLLSDLFRTTLNDLLPEGYDYRKVISINNPLVIDYDFKLDKPKKEKIVLYVGRIDNGFKNVDKLIRAWARIAPHVPDWKFLICGNGGEFEEDKQLIQDEHIPRCEMLGVVNPTDYYKCASVIVMASSASEGWGMVLVEAQQYGCVPIVLNSYASIRDIIQNTINGILVEKNSNWQEIFSNQLLNLLLDKEGREQMMYNAIYSAHRYDINNIGQQWLKLINEQ